MSSIQDPLHDTLQGTVQSPLHDLLGGSAQGSVQGPLHGRHWSRPHAWPTERLSTRLDLTPSARPASGTGPRALCPIRCRGDALHGHCEARRTAGLGAWLAPRPSACCKALVQGPLPNPLPRRRSARRTARLGTRLDLKSLRAARQCPRPLAPPMLTFIARPRPSPLLGRNAWQSSVHGPEPYRLFPFSPHPKRFYSPLPSRTRTHTRRNVRSFVPTAKRKSVAPFCRLAKRASGTRITAVCHSPVPRIVTTGPSV